VVLTDATIAPMSWRDRDAGFKGHRSPALCSFSDGGVNVLRSRRRTLCADAHGWLEVECEDVGVAASAVICAVCHRSNVPGNHSDAGDVFICVRCQANAAQFIAIQDPVVDDTSNWGIP